jgi:metallo-beta-lactamase family protein
LTELSFFGAAGTVTGSCSVIETGGRKFLVDCGMFQGNKTVRKLNYDPFPFDPANVDFVLLTHAHIDHSGLLPKLVKHGFGGSIYCTRPTADLIEFMLFDSAKIQEQNTERENRKRQRRGEAPVEPLYEDQHVETALKLVRTVEYDNWIEPRAGVKARFLNAGHILGSASVEVNFRDADNVMRMLFSGDLGPDEKTFHPEPGGDSGFDYLICESTYGDRDRADYTLESRRDALCDVLVEGLKRGGNVVIPAFAVERSQELLHDIGTLLAANRLPQCTVFLDSPLAKKVTEIFIKYAGTLEDVAVDEAKLFRDPRFHLVHDVEESKNINKIKSGAIIISASGMADAGRIKHHLLHNIWNRKSTILFVGYQAPGTLGNIILNGAPQVRILDRDMTVRAAIRSIGNYSAHADQGELIDWIMERAPVVGGLFLNHGENAARGELRRLLGERGLDIEKIHLPEFDERFEIHAGIASSKGRAAERISQSQLANDWYNDYAAFILALGRKLETEPDPERRSEMIRRLRHDLD